MLEWLGSASPTIYHPRCQAKAGCKCNPLIREIGRQLGANHQRPGSVNRWGTDSIAHHGGTKTRGQECYNFNGRWRGRAPEEIQ